jgi:plastocyanin
MRFSTVVAALLPVAGALAATQSVTVGDGSKLEFNPPSVTAAVGDIIEFEFKTKNHSVSQSTFAQPCQFKSGGVDSGFRATAADATSFAKWSFEVKTTEALWFFCAQLAPADHCQKGMVFAINPTADKSFEAYKAAAINGAAAGGAAGGASGSASAPTGTTLTASGNPSTPTGSAADQGAPPAGSTGSNTGESAASKTGNGGAPTLNRNTIGVMSVAALVLAMTL